MLLASMLPANAALPVTSNPTLTLDHLIRTHPFVGSSVSMRDNEGSAYVPRDNSLWLADDNGRMVYEVNATTGVLKRTFGRTVFEALPKFGGGPAAGTNRDRDFESMAYDSSTDTLYAFSGPCCSSTVLPSVFRFVRVNGQLQPVDYQPLPSGSDFTASAWNPADHKVYVGVGSSLRTYDYATNTPGTIFKVSGLTGILGMDFSPDGKDLFVSRKNTLLSRVDWATKTLVPGWTFDLSPYGMLDTRAVALIGDQFYVSDGYDNRASTDPMNHAVFVFNVNAGTPSGPTASFTASPTSGTAPLTVSFTDTSTGSPTSWSWDFGDGQTSTTQNPSHTYSSAGTFTARLTVSNANGSSSASQTITVSGTTSGNLIGNPGFETNTSGWNVKGNASVSLTRVSGGHTGSWAAKLTNIGTSSTTATLNDHPDWVGTTTSGTYTATLWVRSDVAGSTLKLRLREFQNGTGSLVGMSSSSITLSTSWQKVTVMLAAGAPGQSHIDFTAEVPNTAPGASFYADDASETVS